MQAACTELKSTGPSGILSTRARLAQIAMPNNRASVNAGLPLFSKYQNPCFLKVFGPKF